jgi:hypothetical protein
MLLFFVSGEKRGEEIRCGEMRSSLRLPPLALSHHQPIDRAEREREREREK